MKSVKLTILTLLISNTVALGAGIVNGLTAKIISVRTTIVLGEIKIIELKIENNYGKDVFLECFNQKLLSSKVDSTIDTGSPVTIIIPKLSKILGSLKPYAIFSNVDFFAGHDDQLDSMKTTSEYPPLEIESAKIGYLIRQHSHITLRLFIDMNNEYFYRIDRDGITDGIELGIKINYSIANGNFHETELISEPYFDLKKLFDYRNDR